MPFQFVTGTKLTPLYRNFVLTPPDYDRDIRHYEFDATAVGYQYSVGDCLGIYPHNDRQEVNEVKSFLIYIINFYVVSNLWTFCWDK